MTDTYEKFKIWCEENNTTPSDIQYMINKDERDHIDEVVKKKIDSYKYLIGKCYKTRKDNMWLYYKVISNRSNEITKVSCLIFAEHPRYYFCHNNWQLFSPEDKYEGYFEFDGIYIDDVMFEATSNQTCICRDLIDISKEEYNTAFKNYCNELMELTWEINDGY